MDRFRLHRFDALDSTQTEAKKPQYTAGDVIVTTIQTAGYGRRGRAWQAEPGNLTFTFVENYTGPDQLSWLGYAIGLGLYDAVAPLLRPEAQLHLKWPNDLLIDGLKLSGILLEIENDRLIAGVGMNVAILPDTDQPVTALNRHTEKTYDATEILTLFLRYYQHWFSVGAQGGFAAMREVWLARAASIGRIIQARFADGNTLTGVFKDIDNQGALVLSTENGQYSVTSADIYFN